jgi:putative membrane protein
VWWAENLPILLIVAALVVSYRYHAFSTTAYLLMGCLVFLHTIGGHYTFERVPFSLVTDTFGFSRNHFDRLAHFTVGFYAFAIAEFVLVKKLVCSRAVLYLFPLAVIVAVAAGYEIFEWLYAVSADRTAGAAVLGSQGDPWDAQKDMLADTLGAIAALLLFYRIHRNPLQPGRS